MRAQRIFDDGPHGVGNRLGHGRMAREREGLSQQPLLQHKNRLQDLDAVSKADFFKMLWRWNYFTLVLKRFAHVVGQAQKRVFLVDDQR